MKRYFPQTLRVLMFCFSVLVTYSAVASAVDSDPPIGMVDINGGQAWTNRTAVTLTLTENDESGPVQICINNTGKPCTKWIPFAATKGWTLASGAGQRTVYVWFRDTWKNTSPTPYTDTIGLDTTKPEDGKATVAATAGPGRIDLTWQGFKEDPSATASGITKYRVVWGKGTAPATCLAGNLAYEGAAGSYLHENLINQKYAYRVCAVDGAGNVSPGKTASATPTKADDEAPAGTVTITGGKAWTNKAAVTLALTTSAPESDQMCLNNTGLECTAWQKFAATKGWTLASGAGQRTVYVWFRDTWKNTSPTPYTDTIGLDTTKPEDGRATVAATAGPGRIDLTWQGFKEDPSATASGIAKYRVVWGKGTAPATCLAGNLAYERAAGSYLHENLINQKYAYRVCAVDGAGNVSPGKTASATPNPREYDPPEGTVEINGGQAWTNRTAVTLTLTENDESGPFQICLSNTGKPCTKWIPFSATKNWTLASKDGQKTVYVWLRDTWGNTSPTPHTDTIGLDTVKPANGTVEATPGGGQIALTWQDFMEVPGDKASGIDGYRAVFQKGSAPSSCSSGPIVPDCDGIKTTCVHTGLTTGTAYGYRVCARDRAGNMSTGATASAKPVGPVMVVVPYVVGFEQETAKTAITAAGLTVGAVTNAHSPAIPAGSVISQNPAEGSRVAQGSSVDLRVSLGPSPVTKPEVTRFVRPSEAALLAVRTARGDTVTLEMPRGTLARAQDVTLRVVETPLASPFVTSAVLAGVVVEPTGLPLLRGARIQIDLAAGLLDPRATAIAWIRAPDDALLVGNPSAADRRVQGNLRRLGALQPVDLRVAASVAELPTHAATPVGFAELAAAATDAQSMAILARGLCAARVPCPLGDADSHAARAAVLLGSAIDGLLGDANPADICGSYLADLDDALNAAAGLPDPTSLVAAIQTRLQAIQAQCCAPSSCSPACPDCPDQGRWTVQWYESGRASGKWTLPDRSVYTGIVGSQCAVWVEQDVHGFAEVQYGTGYVSALSIGGIQKQGNREDLTYSGCESGWSWGSYESSCTPSANGFALGEQLLSGAFRGAQPRVSHLEDPIAGAVLEADCTNEVSGASSITDCCGPYCEHYSGESSNRTPWVGHVAVGAGTNSRLLPLDASGLSYWNSVTTQLSPGCGTFQTTAPLTYDIEAAWSDPVPGPPPPPSCRGVTCPPPADECHAPGACNPATGTCSQPTVRTGAACGGSDACLTTGICDAAGSCVAGATLLVCPPPDRQCQESVACDPATGSCRYVSRQDGTPCDDGSACTYPDSCVTGACSGAPKAPCPAVECYAPASCNPTTGTCEYRPLPRGTPCRKGALCDVCDGNGTCEFLSQATLDISCGQLTADTIAQCRNLPNWRVDVQEATNSGDEIDRVACAETADQPVVTGGVEANLCSHAGGGERQSDYYCPPERLLVWSAADDVMCVRAQSRTQGVCAVVCTGCALSSTE